MKIAFWNINKKDLSDLLVEFVNEQQIEILVLAEAEDATLVNFIKKQQLINPSRKFSHIFTGKTHLLSTYSSSVFTRFSGAVNSPRWTFSQIEIPTILSMNFVCVHFHSKVNWSEDSLALECVNLARDIDLFESKTGIDNTMIIGDFNMNPYESGLVAANGLHALPDLNHVSKRTQSRVIDGIKYKYFYNPMWSFFGDKTEPFGTYYYREPGHVSREWNIYDQVIYRPALSDFIQNEGVEIINSIGGELLVNALNRPDRDQYSDHLPITVEFKI